MEEAQQCDNCAHFADGSPKIINQASAEILFIFFLILHIRNMSLFLFA
jgi:hypothetical protein